MKIIRISLFLLFIALTINGMSQQLEFMGLPLHSTISDYSKVLSSHKFKDEYTWGSLAHQYWEGGDFWKQRNCKVRLFAKNDVLVDIIEIKIPYNNFNSYKDYAQVANELISDLSTKYGIPKIDTLKIEKEVDIIFSSADLKNDLCLIYKWTLSNGELRIMVNRNRAYTILIQYKSIEYINCTKDAVRFKGQGTSDL